MTFNGWLWPVIRRVWKENNVMSFRKEISPQNDLSVRLPVLRDHRAEMEQGDHSEDLELLGREDPTGGLDPLGNLAKLDTLGFQGK